MQNIENDRKFMELKAKYFKPVEEVSDLRLSETK